MHPLFFIGVLTFTAPASTAQDWPQFRGPGASGVSTSLELPSSWSETENVAWRTEIPGRGWSSPIVQGDKVFVTTAIQEEGEPEPVKKGLYFGGNRSAPTDSYRWVVYCLKLDSGEVAWEKELHRGVPEHGHHVKGSLASETSVCDGERLYAYVGNVGLFCFDLEGEPLWSKRWKSVPTRYGWGTAASPALHDGRVYLVNDNEEESFLVALDCKTGEEVWRVVRDEKSNWATPFIWENDKRTEIVTPGTGRVRSYGLDGKPLWELGGMSSITIPTPFAAHGMVYVTSGYVGDRRKPVFAIRPGAQGDISLEGAETQNEFIAWCQKKAGPYNPSPVLYDGRLYVLYDQGFMACFDALTGEEIPVGWPRTFPSPRCGPMTARCSARAKMATPSSFGRAPSSRSSGRTASESCAWPRRPLLKMGSSSGPKITSFVFGERRASLALRGWVLPRAFGFVP